MEAGQKGIWAEYPNLLALLDELAPGGQDAALTRPTRSGFYSSRGLEVSAPVFGKLPRLPAPVGTLVYTSPFFRQVSVEARLSALGLVPELLRALAVEPRDEGSAGLDDVSAEELFMKQGLSPELYNAFVRPVLQALLFRPPAELSALVVLRVLWCYVFKTQSSFDVRWFRGPLDELLVRPIVSEIERLGGSVEEGTRLSGVRLDQAGRVVSVDVHRAGDASFQQVPTDAVVLAAGAAGTLRTIEGFAPEAQARLGTTFLTGLRRIRSTECMAVRFALDRLCPTEFSSNVLSGLEGLEETGATFFMLERLQPSLWRSYAGGRLRGCSVVAIDFYGSDRGRLASMPDEEVAEYALSLLRRADPLAFEEARLAAGVEVVVLRARGAATHFAPGSRRCRPRQRTAIPNLFLAGDYVKGLEHGAEGLSQERALVSGFEAANLAMDEVEARAAPGRLRRQQVLPLSPDEPQVQLLRALQRGL